MTRLTLVVCLFVVCAPAAAQDHTQLVADTKAQLVQQGVSIVDSCGAFEITKRVAWRLRGEGAGLLGGKSGAQNRCGEYAVDIVMYPDGRYFDILVDSGATNQPAWGGPNEGDPRLWRAPMDPGGTLTLLPTGTATSPVTPVPTIDLSPVKGWIDALAADERAHTAEARDRDERIYADEKAIAASHYQQLTTQISNLSHEFAAQQRPGNPLGFLKNRTFLEVLTGLTGAIAFIKK